jgi:hypothetical protein
MSRSINSKVLAVLMAASALLVPVAQAKPIDPPITRGAAPSAPVQSPQVQHGLTSVFTTNAPEHGTHSGLPASRTASDGFSWGDAGIGAGATLVLVGLATLAAVSFSRSRARPLRRAT